MWKLIFVMLVTITGTAASVMAAPAVVCESGTWADVPMLQAGVFVGSIQSTCDVSNATSASMLKLGQYFQAKVGQDVVTLYEGPVLDATLGVPAVRYDETVRTPDGQIRNLIRLGGNGAGLFMYSSHSKEIYFNGTAGYLRRLNIDFKIEMLQNQHLKITLLNLTNVQKPGLVPGGIFLNMAKSRSLTQYQSSLEALAKEVAEHL